MNGLEFVASLVHSLAWPMSVAFVAWLLRKQLAVLLDAPLKKLKVGPVEAEWVRTAREVAESIPVVAKGRAESSSDKTVQKLLELAESAPGAAIVESFKLLEAKVRELASGVGIEDADRQPVVRLAGEVASQGGMTPESAHAIKGMAVMRNLAAHGDGREPSATPEKAREYVELAEATLFTLEAPPKRRASRPTTPASG